MPTKTDLLCKAKELGLRGYTGMNKDALEKFVIANTPKTIRVKRPKVSKKTTPAIDTSALDEAKKYLEDLEQKKIVKGVAKLKDTISKGKAENLLRKAMAKYKASKAEKAKGKAEGLLKKAMAKFKEGYGERKPIKIINLKETINSLREAKEDAINAFERFKKDQGTSSRLAHNADIYDFLTDNIDYYRKQLGAEVLRYNSLVKDMPTEPKYTLDGDLQEAKKSRG